MINDLGPRVAVYAIAKDSERTVGRWCASAEGADETLLVDTGSTDQTIERAERSGVEVRSIHVDPFRFDEARNCALEFIREDIDICVPLDLDEILAPGWLQQLRAVWNPSVTRVEYWLDWRWSHMYAPLRYRAQKIHARHGYRWRRPVHEQLVTLEPEIVVPSPIQVRHLRDAWEPRHDHMNLLRLAVKECPSDGQAHHMLANEARLLGFPHEARQHAEAALTLALEPFERMHTMLILSWLDSAAREFWLLSACSEFPDQREPWCELAKFHLEHRRWNACLSTALAALRVNEPPNHYLMDVFAWGHLPHELAAEACAQLGDRDEAVHHARRAQAAAPHDTRLAETLADALRRLPSACWTPSRIA